MYATLIVPDGKKGVDIPPIGYYTMRYEWSHDR